METIKWYEETVKVVEHLDCSIPRVIMDIVEVDGNVYNIMWNDFGELVAVKQKRKEK